MSIYDRQLNGKLYSKLHSYACGCKPGKFHLLVNNSKTACGRTLRHNTFITFASGVDKISCLGCIKAEPSVLEKLGWL